MRIRAEEIPILVEIILQVSKMTAQDMVGIFVILNIIALLLHP